MDSLSLDTHGAPSPDDAVFEFNLKRYLEALRRYVWALLALVALAVVGAVLYTNRQAEIYSARASVQIEPRLPDLLGQTQMQLSRATPGGLDYYMQQKEVLGSYTLIRQTVAQHHLYTRMLTAAQRGNRKVDDLVEDATAQLRKHLAIDYPKENRIMYVTVRDADRQLAADIANAHIATYIAYSKGLLSTDTRDASGALSTEFDQAETALHDADSALYQYQQDNHLLERSLDDQRDAMSSEITSYSSKRNEARGKRIELQARRDRMREAAKLDVLESPILLMTENPAFDTLRSKYYEERNKFIEVEQEVGPKNPRYQMQKAKVDDLYNTLETESRRMLAGIESQVQAASQAENALKAEVDRATKEALDLGPKVVAYNTLLRQKKSAEDRYELLRGRLSASEMNDRMNRSYDYSNVKPLDPALVPTKPVYPNLRINIVFGAVVALMLGMGLIVLIVFLDRSVTSTADVAQITNVPVLGVIPNLPPSDLPVGDDSARDLYVFRQPASSIAECCRSLRTNIMFSDADHRLKTILVSSANPREGKTTSVIYLGTTMAQGGQRVLLIDTDMRRPRLHVSMGISRHTGLSNLIVGDREFEDCIKTTEIPNLFVLPCGPLPPNPAELLMSQRFRTVLAELQTRYDRIILDSPPVQVVTDAVVLSKVTDGTMLVVRAGKTLRDDIRRAERNIRNVGGRFFGVIVNALEPDTRSGYYYSYYGYTEADGPKPPAPAAPTAPQS